MKLQKIFELVLHNYQTLGVGRGICYELLSLHVDNVITIHEKTRATKFLNVNKPSSTLHTDFYNHESYFKIYDEEMDYWWPTEDINITATIVPERVRFIEHLINICKEQNL